MIRLFSAILLALGLAATASAQGVRVENQTTPGGMPYLRIPMPNTQMQSIQLLWSDQGMQARDAKPGLPIAVSYLMGREPRGEKLGELLETLRDYQAGFHVSTSANANGISITIPPEHFASAMALIHKFIHDPALPQDRLDTYRRDVELRAIQALRQGDLQASQLRLRALMPDGPLRRYHLTDQKKLDGVTAADVRTWLGTLARDRLRIVTAGPMTAEALGSQLDTLVAPFPATWARLPAENTILRPDRRTIVLERPVPQTIIQAFGPAEIGPVFDPIRASMAVARLGGGSQGRLHAALRDRLGATYGVSVSIDSFSWMVHGVSLRTAVSPELAADALRALREEYARWWQEGVSEAEFAATRSSMIGNRRASRLQPGTVAINVINGIARGAPVDYYTAYDREVESITREEVNAYIKARFPKELGFIVVAPSAAGLGADCVIQRLEEAATCGL